MELDTNMDPMDKTIQLEVSNFDKPWVCPICNYRNGQYRGRCVMCIAFHPRVERDYKEKVVIKKLLMSVSNPCYEETFEIFIKHGFTRWKCIEVMEREDLKEMNVKMEWRKSIWVAIRKEMTRRQIEKRDKKIKTEISPWGGIIFKNLIDMSD